MNAWRNLAAIACAVMVTSLSACTSPSGHVQHYVSGAIKGESQKINLEEVQKAFFETKGADFNSQMAAFEKRVNEIYDGQGVVALDATKENSRLKVTGFISKDNKPGLQPGDEVLFTIEQTGDVVNNDMPYRMTGYNNTPYYVGHHSILDSPLVQFMVLSHLMGGWGGRYYTPYSNYGSILGYRNTWRASPTYTQQQQANNSFFSRFKTNQSGSGFASSTKFGGNPFSSGSATTVNRTWGSTVSSPASGSGLGWGGRRSTGFGSGSSFGSSGFGGGGRGFSMGRGWGGRRGR